MPLTPIQIRRSLPFAAVCLLLLALSAPVQARQANPWTFPNKQPNTAYFSAYGGDTTRVSTVVQPFRTSPLRITYTLPDAFKIGQRTTVKVKFQYVSSTIVGNYCVQVPYGPIGCATSGTGVNSSYKSTFGSRKIQVRALLTTDTNSFANGQSESFTGPGKRVSVKPGGSATMSFKVKFSKCFDWPATFTSPVFNDYGNRPTVRWTGYACAPAGLNIAYDAVARGAKNAAKWTRGRVGTRTGESTGLFNLVSIKLLP